MVYVFIGQDNLSKSTRLAALKRECYPSESEQFNLEILYGRDLSVKMLQERILCLPAMGAKKRLVVIRQASGLRREVREYLTQYCRKPAAHVVLVLDIDFLDYREMGWKALLDKTKVLRFKEEPRLDAFALGRLVVQKRPEQALRTLHHLLTQGQKPELILGGVRYVLEHEVVQGREKMKGLRLLVTCDTEIKTGRLKPQIALEKLVVGLCCLGKPAH